MYHIFKDDPWGNKIAVMSIGDKRSADAYVKRNKDIVTKVVNVPRSKSTIILM